MSAFPRYFIVDMDIPVKVDAKDGEVFGETSSGNPYSPFKALAEGTEVDYEAFKRASTALAASS